MDYVKKLVPFGMVKINIISLVMLALSLAVGLTLNILVFKVANSYLFDFQVSIINIILEFVVLIAVYVVYLAVHELLHAVGFLMSKSVKKGDIKFGLNIKKGIAYCSAKKPIIKSAYTFAIILPFLLTFIAFAVGIIFLPRTWVFLLSLCICGCAGDIVMFFDIVKYPKTQLFLDHPTIPGYYIIYEDGKQPEGFTETTKEQEERILEKLKWK